MIAVIVPIYNTEKYLHIMKKQYLKYHKKYDYLFKNVYMKMYPSLKDIYKKVRSFNLIEK